MTWIKTIAYEEAEGKVKDLYERIKGPNNNVDNIMMAHSLRPHSMEGHMALYKNVLHHSRNTLPKWLLEAIGVCVSIINQCEYCIEHHYEGMRKLIEDDQRSQSIRKALEEDDPSKVFESKELATINYAVKLTINPHDISPEDIEKLRINNVEDGEILEINQVAAYFAYANRMVLGLGINKSGDIIGLSPNDGDDVNNWSHS
tara:strand:- start:2227 stop:2832 length:606 start_codon:yes stop_codon:yes gene_type:complete